jgi:hypothetical protein
MDAKTNKVRIFLQVLFLSFFLSTAVWAEEGTDASRKTKPFKDRNAFIQALINADFSQIFEFKFKNTDNISVYVQIYDSQQKKSFKKISYEDLIKNRARWVPVPALDYEMEKQPIWKRTPMLMRAYKVGGSLICHDPSDSWALDNTFYCISVPMNVDLVIQRMQLRGVLNQ